MTQHIVRVRLPLRVAALALLSVVAVTSCSGGGNDAGPAGTTGASAPATAGGTATTTGVTVAPATPEDLQRALSALDGGYHFAATVSVNDQVSVQAEGDRIGADSRLDITSNGATVSYVIIGGVSYAKPSDGDWEQLETAPATSDPINALRAPTSVAPVESTDGMQHLTVTVPASALGITADGDVPVQVVLSAGVLTEVRYSAAVEGGTALVVTVISALTDTTPITAPI